MNFKVKHYLDSKIYRLYKAYNVLLCSYHNYILLFNLNTTTLIIILSTLLRVFTGIIMAYYKEEFKFRN